jgi:hypothetical protein
MAGTAAARREQQKRATYSRLEPNGYPFVPFSVASYGHIGQPAMKLLHALGDDAAGPGRVTRASFVAGALREISVGLCRGNFFMYRACWGMIAKASATGFRAGMRVPTRMNKGCCRLRILCRIIVYIGDFLFQSKQVRLHSKALLSCVSTHAIACQMMY